MPDNVTIGFKTEGIEGIQQGIGVLIEQQQKLGEAMGKMAEAGHRSAGALEKVTGSAMSVGRELLGIAGISLSIGGLVSIFEKFNEHMSALAEKAKEVRGGLKEIAAAQAGAGLAEGAAKKAADLGAQYGMAPAEAQKTYAMMLKGYAGNEDLATRASAQAMGLAQLGADPNAVRKIIFAGAAKGLEPERAAGMALAGEGKAGVGLMEYMQVLAGGSQIEDPALNAAISAAVTRMEPGDLGLAGAAKERIGDVLHTMLPDKLRSKMRGKERAGGFQYEGLDEAGKLEAIKGAMPGLAESDFEKMGYRRETAMAMAKFFSQGEGTMLAAHGAAIGAGYGPGGGDVVGERIKALMRESPTLAAIATAESTEGRTAIAGAMGPAGLRAAKRKGEEADFASFIQGAGLDEGYLGGLYKTTEGKLTGFGRASLQAGKFIQNPEARERRINAMTIGEPRETLGDQPNTEATAENTKTLSENNGLLRQLLVAIGNVGGNPYLAGALPRRNAHAE